MLTETVVHMPKPPACRGPQASQGLYLTSWGLLLPASEEKAGLFLWILEQACGANAAWDRLTSFANHIAGPGLVFVPMALCLASSEA